MDSALLKEREAFKRRAMAVPTVENKAAKRSDGSRDAKDKKKSAALGAQSQSAKAKQEMAQMKAAAANTSSSSFGMGAGSSSYKFGVLAKIVRHMKTRHMEGEDHRLNLDEILDETNQTDVSNKVKAWLSTEALKNNPKIDVADDLTYIYKPPYDIMSRKALLKMLRRHDLKGMGGVFLEDIQESLPKCDNIIRRLTEEDKILIVQRTVDKKKVVFFHDHTSDFIVDEEFQKLWRSVAVEGLDDAKIDEYLDKQGIKSMTDQGAAGRKVMQKKIRKKPARRRVKPKDNEHMGDVLEDYSELTAEKRDA